MVIVAGIGINDQNQNKAYCASLRANALRKALTYLFYLHLWVNSKANFV